MFVFKYENDSYGIPYLIATRFSPAGVNPFPVMAGLLTRPSRRTFPALHQWQVAATLRGLTAAGTVPDSHRIPFSSVAANRPEPFPITKIQIFFIIISFTRKKSATCRNHSALYFQKKVSWQRFSSPGDRRPSMSRRTGIP